MSRRRFLASTAMAIGAGALLESQTGVTSQAKDIVSRNIDRVFDGSEHEITYEEVLPVLFQEVIKKLTTAEGQARFNVSATDKEWTFARESIENDTGKHGPYGEGTINYGIVAGEDDSTERVYYEEMFSVKEAIEVWVIRKKEDGEIIERGLSFGLPDYISDEQDVMTAMEKYLTIPDETIGTSTTSLTWSNPPSSHMLENYELSGWGSDGVRHDVEAVGNFMSYSTEQRDNF